MSLNAEGSADAQTSQQPSTHQTYHICQLIHSPQTNQVQTRHNIYVAFGAGAKFAPEVNCLLAFTFLMHNCHGDIILLFTIIAN